MERKHVEFAEIVELLNLLFIAKIKWKFYVIKTLFLHTFVLSSYQSSSPPFFNSNYLFSQFSRN